MFENNRVAADSVASFLEKYYKPQRYQERGEAYAAAVLASHEQHFERCGYDIISRHESVTGKVVAYFGHKQAATQPIAELSIEKEN